MNERLQKLIGNREAALKKAQGIIDANPDKLTKEQSKEVSDLHAQINGFDTEIAILEAQIKAENEQDAIALNMRQPADNRFIPGDPANKGLSNKEQKDLRNYSVLNALQASVGYAPLEGLTKEMHQEGISEYKDCGISHKTGGVVIPEKVMSAGSRYIRNDVNTGSGTGGDRIDTELRSPIDVLLDKTVTRELGATYLTGLRGDITFPTMTSAAEPAEKAENAAATEIQPTTGSKSMTPTRLPAYTEISEQLLKQDAFGIEQWVRNHLFELVAIRMDRMAVNGSGASNEPTGILNAAGLSLISHGTDGGAPVRTTLTRTAGTVDVANAMMGNLGYLTNGKVETTLKETKVDTGSGQFVWPEGASTLNGHKAVSSNLVPSNLTKGAGTDLSALIFGNWRDLYVGMWGGIELKSNPYVKMDEGIVQVHVVSYYDILVSRVASFAAANDLVTVI